MSQCMKCGIRTGGVVVNGTDTCGDVRCVAAATLPDDAAALTAGMKAAGKWLGTTYQTYDMYAIPPEGMTAFFREFLRTYKKELSK